MTTPEPDFTKARNLMVDGQLRPNKVTDRALLDILRRLKREDFVPQALRGFAYIDDDLKMSASRVLMKPLVLARLLQLAVPLAGETALVVGAGTGYGATILAQLGVQVTALEEDPELAAQSREAAMRCTTPPESDHVAAGLASAGQPFPVSFVTGKLADGYPDRAPYDLILIEGAVRAIPERIGRQVAQNGRLVTVLAAENAVPTAIIAEPSVGGMRARPAFDANTALLPQLLPVPSFAF